MPVYVARRLGQPAWFGCDARNEIIEDPLIIIKQQIVRQFEPQFTHLAHDWIVEEGRVV